LKTPSITSRFVTVNGQPMHYLEAGAGTPILFLHGNPTSSYLWRNVIPVVAQCGRCIAVDLIGMGKSAKPEIGYRLQDHIAFLDGFIEALNLSEITFVLHDWGVSIGLHYLTRFPERVRAVAFMEGHLGPIEHWTDLEPDARDMFQRLRSEEIGRQLVIAENFFVDTVLPSGILRTLTQDELAAYRTPYLRPRDREPIWRWVCEIPIEGHPADVHEIVTAYREGLARSPVPKLLLHAHPGAVIGAVQIAWCRQSLTNLTTVDLGEGIHFLPEDHPESIGLAIVRWLEASAIV